jgi:hypothetical protein
MMERACMAIDYTALLMQLAFLAWLAYRTRLGPVLFYLVWQVVSIGVSWGLLSYGLTRAHWRFEHQGYLEAWGYADRLIMAGSFIWMILSMMRWGRGHVPLSWRHPA